MTLSVITKNGFVYLADETGKKIATVFGSNAVIWDRAYLLAAAPDMLAALRMAAGELEGAAFSAALIKARAAIAKVEGRANG